MAGLGSTGGMCAKDVLPTATTELLSGSVGQLLIYRVAALHCVQHCKLKGNHDTCSIVSWAVSRPVIRQACEDGAWKGIL